MRDRRRKFVDNTDRGNKPDHADGDPRPAVVTFVTTEHFTLQGARSSTISESTGRASVFLGAVSGGLIALGLVATAAKTGVAFYMFGLILLPTLAFVGLATFHRVLQSGIEDLAYARRIAQLRDYYFDLGRRATRGRSFWPIAGSDACRRRGRRRCGTDRADAVSEFGLDQGQHGIVVPGAEAGSIRRETGQLSQSQAPPDRADHQAAR